MAKASWGMVIDVDKCTGCQACVVACQSENNIPINEEAHFNQRRAIEWIRVERYWEGEFPDVKARFIPILCQHCDDAPCEPVCPVFATYHNEEGLNVQVYNRCVGTRFCSNNCPYHVRFFNFWEPAWPESLKNQLNPDVTVRSRGIMEKCTFCVQRIRRTTREAERDGAYLTDNDRALNPACVNACPTEALVFGDLNQPESRVAKIQDRELRENGRGYHMLESLGTNPSVVYLKKVDKHELFVGVGTLVAMNTLSAGWKYYLLDSPIHLYSVVSIQGIAGMGGGFISPFLSVGAEKSITDKLYINLGLNTVIRVYRNRPIELVPFPNVNLNWRY